MFRGDITVNDKSIGSWKAVRLDTPIDEQGKRRYSYWVNIAEHVNAEETHYHGTVSHNPRDGFMALFFKIIQSVRIEKQLHDLQEVVNPQ